MNRLMNRLKQRLIAFVRKHTYALIAVAVGLVVLGVICAACGPSTSPAPASLTPVSPVLPRAPAAPEPEPPAPPTDGVLATEGGDSLTVPRLLDPIAGTTDTLRIALVAGAPNAFEFIIAQDDTTTAAMRFDGLEHTYGALAPADDLGQVLARADRIVIIQSRFLLPGRTVFEIPIEAKAPGVPAGIFIQWQRASGEVLGIAGTEIRVR